MALQQPSVNAGLRPPPSAADGVDRGLPDSRWHLIDQWPGAASHAWQILCQIIGHRRIYADSRRHRHRYLEKLAHVHRLADSELKKLSDGRRNVFDLAASMNGHQLCLPQTLDGDVCIDGRVTASGQEHQPIIEQFPVY